MSPWGSFLLDVVFPGRAPLPEWKIWIADRAQWVIAVGVFVALAVVLAGAVWLN